MRTKKIKPPPDKFEYVLRISKEFDSFKNAPYFSFMFNTTKKFLTFRYILSIETEIKDNNLNFEILGFKAPIGELSNFGEAEYEFRLYQFNFSEYNVSIHRKDVDSVKFKLLFQSSDIIPVKIGRLSKNSFIEITTA